MYIYFQITVKCRISVADMTREALEATEDEVYIYIYLHMHIHILYLYLYGEVQDWCGGHDQRGFGSDRG